jgi:hypothetical protein
MVRNRVIATGVGAVTLALAPFAAQPQLVQGTVLDAERARPLAAAFVALLDTAGNITMGSSTDRQGRFTLRTSDVGVYAVMARHSGFRRTRSDWLVIDPGDTLLVTIRLPREATVLSPIVVKAQRDSLADLRAYGIPLKTLVGTFITRAELEHAAEGSSGIFDVIEKLRIPSLYVRYMNVTTGDARTAGGDPRIAFSRTGKCVTIVVDAIKYSTWKDVLNLEEIVRPEQIKGMVMLRPAEAGVLFGMESGNGVLLIITKR